MSDISIEYSRPSAKGRVVFGDVVPFGKVWRTGANGGTKITFGEDVKVEGNALLQELMLYIPFRTKTAGKLSFTKILL